MLNYNFGVGTYEQILLIQTSSQPADYTSGTQNYDNSNGNVVSNQNMYANPAVAQNSVPSQQSSTIKPIPVDPPESMQQNQEYPQYMPTNNPGNQPTPFQMENAPMLPNQQYYRPRNDTYTLHLPFKKTIQVRMKIFIQI